jgi:hypothetical protein
VVKGPLQFLGKPVLAHSDEKVVGNVDARLVADDSVNSAARADGSLTLSVLVLVGLTLSPNFETAEK